MLRRTKTFKRIKLVLASILIATTIFTVKGFINQQVPQQRQSTIIESQEGLSEVKYSIREVSNEIHKVGKLQVLEGNTKTEYTFSTKNKEIMTAEKTSCISWIKQKFSDLTLNEVLYKSSYDYIFSYDLNKIEVRKENGDLKIHIYETDLQLDKVVEKHNETEITSDKGILAKQFTPSQVGGMAKYVENKTYNKLINDKDIKDTAMESLKANINSICESLEVDDYEIVVHSNNTLAYTDNYLK